MTIKIVPNERGTRLESWRTPELHFTRGRSKG